MPNTWRDPFHNVKLYPNRAGSVTSITTREMHSLAAAHDVLSRHRINLTRISNRTLNDNPELRVHFRRSMRFFASSRVSSSREDASEPAPEI